MLLLSFDTKMVDNEIIFVMPIQILAILYFIWSLESGPITDGLSQGLHVNDLSLFPETCK